jgi:hypothetical protein
MGSIQGSRLRATAVAVLLAVTLPVLATEGGGSIYPNGAENFMVGALPPPGTYYLLYGSHYEADRLRDNAGNRVPIDFKVKATAVVPRLLWVTDQQIMGGQLAFYGFFPLVDLKVRVGGASDSASGLGDITLGGGLGYHVSDKLHYAFAVDVNAPTGRYDKNALANVSRNYWNIEPLFALSYVQGSGLNADLKVMYDFNARNKATDYRSGQELHADFSAGWAFGNGWTLGVGGYAYRQTTDDRLAGAKVPDNRGRAYAIGPSIKYDSGKGWFLTAKYESEFDVRNRAEGAGFKLKAVLPF